MTPADFAALPWTPIIGVTGIVGTFLSGFLANRAADKRRLADQQHEDRTRFHKERIELYTRFLNAANLLLSSQLMPRDQAASTAMVFADLNRVLDTIRIIATKPVTTVALDVVTAVMSYHTAEMLKVVGELQQSPQPASASKDGMLTAVAIFREAVRVELGVEVAI